MTTAYMLVVAALVTATASQGEDAGVGPKVERAVATLNGVFSPRGFFNITVRLYQLPGVVIDHLKSSFSELSPV